MRYWMPLIAILSLAGCSNAAQRADMLDRLSPDYAERQRMAKQCDAFGAKGTPAYAQCMLQVEQIAAQNRPVTVNVNR